MPRILALLTLALGTTALSADEADELLKKILAAQAKDPANAKKLETVVCNGEGTSRWDEQIVQVKMHRQGAWPGRFRAEYLFTSGTKKLENIACVRDDRGWWSQQGNVSDLTVAQVAEYRAMGYDWWMALLVPLRETGSLLATIPGVKIDGEPTVGLRVTRKAWPDMALYFDEKTLLLRKQVYRRADEGITKTFDHTYRDYKEIEGLQLPTKMRTLIGTIEAFNIEKLEFTFPASVNKEAFEKPRR